MSSHMVLDLMGRTFTRDLPMSLVMTVRTELLARKGDWPEMCRQTGISYWWLTKFAQGRIDNPGVVKLERLVEHFAAHPRTESPEAV